LHVHQAAHRPNCPAEKWTPDFGPLAKLDFFGFCWGETNSKTMSKTKRRKHSGAFKAKVGLEALMGVKTVGQIAREYEVHPVQVTQWKSVIRDRLPELFEPAGEREESEQALIAQLHEKIGQLAVEADWLKKKCKQLGL
jgi:transposase-like protein